MMRIAKFVMFSVVLLAAYAAAAGTPYPSTGVHHTVTVNIPDLVAIRMVAGNGTPIAWTSTTTPDVGFDYASTSAEVEQYLNAIGSTTAYLPSNTSALPALGDIQVFSNDSSGWTVSVQTSAGTPTGTAANPAFPASQVFLDPSTMDGTYVSLDGVTAPFSLPAVGATSLPVFKNVTTNPTTQGWKSLGVKNSAYEIQVNGSEAPGNTVIDVTYTITSP